MKTDFSAIPPLIQWHEGMMLSPHHFQQNDIHFHRVIAHQLKLFSGYFWGIQHLKIDPVVLSDGLVRILELEALMPDGLIVSYSAEKDQERPPLEIDLKAFKPETPEEEIVVQLALPNYPSKGSPLIGKLPRYYSVEGQEINDVNVGDHPIHIPRLIPRLFLHVGKETPNQSISFPILKIIFVNEAFIKTKYTRPCFFLEKNTVLWEDCAKFIKRVREKALYLSSKLHDQGTVELFRETVDLLKPLMMSLPCFETLIHGDTIHPYYIYLRLCEIVGHLSCLHLTQVPPVLPIYNHNNINECFYPVLDLLNGYLDVIDISFTTIAFKQKERLFYTLLKESPLQKIIYVGLRIPRGRTEKHMEEWMKEAIIVSDNAIDSVREKRITGAHRSLIHQGKVFEFISSRDILVFEIKFDPKYIQINQNLHIFNPSDKQEERPKEIFLYISKSKNKEPS
ncbi:MAG: type VI secretion system baseplate subunit TssK [Alphaproteobacteria bacterium]